MIYNSILNLYNPIQGPNTYLMCPGMYSGYTRVLYEGHQDSELSLLGFSNKLFRSGTNRSGSRLVQFKELLPSS